MKHCTRYKAVKNQKTAALGKEPKAAATPAATSASPASIAGGSPDLATPWTELIKSMDEFSRKLNEPPSTQQRRRTILQAAKAHVIDSYRTPLGQVSIAMRGAAKAGIERELSALPLEELPFEEVVELAVAIRDRHYAPVFRKEAHEAERLRVQQAAQHQKEIEALGALIRAERRKTTLIDQALSQARAECEAHQIVGWDRLSLLSDVKSRLTELLTGDEPVPEAQVIVHGVLEARLAEAKATLAAAQAKADAKWREDLEGALVLSALAGLIVLALKFPEQALPILQWIERTFGLTPAPETGPASTEASGPAASPASASTPPPRRPRRTVKVPSPCPESPTWERPVEETAQAEG
jgi:hypothetical protein